MTCQQHGEGTVVSLEELLVYIVAPAGAATVALIVLYATRLRKSEKEQDLNPLLQHEPKFKAAERWRQRAKRSVSPSEADEARDELRTLGLEREILSDAIRRLYEAHAEGKITEEERELLAKRYKSRMLRVKDALTDSESVVALHELEAMQEDLFRLFDERLDELNSKIETLRSQIGLEPEEAIVPVPISAPVETAETERVPATRKKKKTGRKPQKPRKTPAEERIEKIQAEVEKVLDRLGQMEAEA
jgi:hypothetical protein